MSEPLQDPNMFVCPGRHLSDQLVMVMIATTQGRQGSEMLEPRGERVRWFCLFPNILLNAVGPLARSTAWNQ